MEPDGLAWRPVSRGVSGKVGLEVAGVAAMHRRGSGRAAGWGWREQAEGAGALDRLGATVRAELVEEVAYVRPDCVHRYGQLAGDLRHGQVGRQVTQHPDLGLAQRIYQAKGVCWPGRPLRRL